MSFDKRDYKFDRIAIDDVDEGSVAVKSVEPLPFRDWHPSDRCRDLFETLQDVSDRQGMRVFEGIELRTFCTFVSKHSNNMKVKY
jgi:hypothetical protein